MLYPLVSYYTYHSNIWRDHIMLLVTVKFSLTIHYFRSIAIKYVFRIKIPYIFSFIKEEQAWEFNVPIH